jgi:2,3-bisphosphoglycerate-dependent phosphoglycerate mutase
MQLYFIRHGQSENNLLYTETGSSEARSEDPELTELGRQQAKLLAQHIRRRDSVATMPNGKPRVAEFGFTHLYTSLMVRAVATANIIAEELNLPLLAWEDLHEAGGIYRSDPESAAHIGLPGRTREYFERNYPALILPSWFGQAGWWNKPREEYDAVSLRAARWLRELQLRHGSTQDHVAVVSHGGFYNVLLRTIFEIGKEDYWFALNNAAITRIDFNATEVGLVYHNRVDFLPPDLVT